VIGRRFEQIAAFANGVPECLTFPARHGELVDRRKATLVVPRSHELLSALVAPYSRKRSERQRGVQRSRWRQTPVAQISTGDIEALRDARIAKGLSAYTINHDLKLLRKMFNWGIRRGYAERSPFKIGTEPAVALDCEIPRDRRFRDDDDEQRLLAAILTFAPSSLRSSIPFFLVILPTCRRLGFPNYAARPGESGDTSRGADGTRRLKGHASFCP
jgi:hypothetical protein